MNDLENNKDKEIQNITTIFMANLSPNLSSIPQPHNGVKDMSWAKGLWIAIHLTGAFATSVERAQYYCDWLRMIIANLPCGDCSNHAADYVALNPPEDAEDCFIHSWRFHNAVNKRLNKPIVDYNTAANMYLGGGIKSICTAGCGK